ncbi:hypothetical protein ES705_35402 [subsurface metagenome]
MKKLFYTLLFILIGNIILADQIIDHSLFKFDKKVNNDFISSYTFGDPEYFRNFFAIDAAYYEADGLYYGIGIEKAMNAAYYFDLNNKPVISIW